MLDRLFGPRLDAVLTPAAPGEAPEGLQTTGDWVFNEMWTLLHVPCVAIPVGRGPKNLPVGIQLVGAPAAEELLISLSAQIEAAAPPVDTIADAAALVPSLDADLAAYRDATFIIGLFLGPDHRVAFTNGMAERVLGVAPESPASALFRRRRAEPSAAPVRRLLDDVLSTGLTRFAQGEVTWLRDDGTLARGAFFCLLQPLRTGAGRVLGIFWICMPEAARASLPSV
jgi:PAS domain-containing protein